MPLITEYLLFSINYSETDYTHVPQLAEISSVVFINIIGGTIQGCCERLSYFG